MKLVTNINHELKNKSHYNSSNHNLEANTNSMSNQGINLASLPKTL